MKPDEREFLLRLWEHHQTVERCGPGWKRADDIAAEIGMHSKRCHYLLGKWTGKRNVWNYGVTARTGWFDEGAPAYVEKARR